MSDRQPDWTGDGLPGCSREGCPQFDGKRCREMGFRPSAHCEPQLIDDYALLRKLRTCAGILGAAFDQLKPESEDGKRIVALFDSIVGEFG